MRSLTVFETDDGRTVLELIASNKFCVFISFFLKPLSVRLPLAARFTNAEWLFELTLQFFRRASAMTAKVWALPDSPAAGVADALRRRKNWTARERVMSLEKSHGAASSQWQMDETAPLSRETRHAQNTSTKIFCRRQARFSKFQTFDRGNAPLPAAAGNGQNHRNFSSLAVEQIEQFSSKVARH